MTELTVARNKLESFLPVLGVEVTDDEKLRDIETDTILTDDDGNKLTIDEIGYLVADDGDVKPVKDNFADIVGELSNHRDD